MVSIESPANVYYMSNKHIWKTPLLHQTHARSQLSEGG